MDAWREEAAVRALERAEVAVVSALCRLGAADDPDWTGGPATRYRAEVERVVDLVRAARARLADAVRAAEAHAEAVRREGVTTLGAPPQWGGPRGFVPWPPALADGRASADRRGPSGRGPAAGDLVPGPHGG